MRTKNILLTSVAGDEKSNTTDATLRDIRTRSDEDPPIPTPPGEDPPPPIREPPDTPVAEPDRPVREPGPPEPRRL
jgi:hypothetical protein